MIEIIPWLHSLRRSSHQDVVRYVKTLPHHTVVALEMPPIHVENYRLFKSLSTEQLRDNFRAYTHDAKRQLKEGNTDIYLWLAAMEVLMECKKRNLRLFFLGNKKTDKVGRETAGISDSLRVSHQRDKIYANVIMKYVKSKKPSRIVVIAGQGHAIGICGSLQESGIPAKINFTPLRQRAIVKATIKLRHAALKKAMNGNEEEAEQIMKERVNPPIERMTVQPLFPHMRLYRHLLRLRKQRKKRAK